MSETTFIKVTSIDHLKELSSREEGEEFFISMGICRSSKRVWYDEYTKLFTIYNEIDDTEEEEVTEQYVKKNTNIVDAIERGAFYKY